MKSTLLAGLYRGRIKTSWLVKEFVRAAALLAGVSYLFFGSLPVSSCSLLLVPFMIKERVKEKEKLMKRQLRDDFLELLRVLMVFLSAGHSPENSLGEAMGPMEDMFGGERGIVRFLRDVGVKTEGGMPVGDALETAARDTGIEAINDFALVFSAVTDKGGDGAAALAVSASRIERAVTAENEIITAMSGRIAEQKIMLLMPPAAILMWRVMSPSESGIMYGTAAGRAVMAVCAVLYAVSFRWSKRMREKGGDML